MSDKKTVTTPFVPPKKQVPLEEKVSQLQERVESYIDRLRELEIEVQKLFDTEVDSDYEPVYTPFTISWMPDNPPRVTQRDREIALWRKRTRNDLYLYCDEEIKDF